MAELIKGVGAVWGIGASSTTFGTGSLVQSMDFGVESESVEIKNAKGECVGKIFYNEKNTLTCEVIPSGASISAARTNNVLPAPGTLVTIVDATEDTELAGTHTGKFVFTGGSKKKSNTGLTVLTFNLEQYVANDISTTISS